MKRSNIERVTRHVQRSAVTARESGRANWREVRLRRPFAWSRADLDQYARLGVQRRHWSYEMQQAGDMLVLHVRDELVEMEDMRMSKNVIELNDRNFETQVVRSELPVLVDFTATWCGPCKAIAPTIKKIADEYEGRLKVGKVDVDTNPRTVAQYGIKGMPTLLVFVGGKVMANKSGAMPRREINDLIQRALVAC